MGKSKKQRPRILWLDCIGGLVVGSVVLCACPLICRWDSLPVGIVVGVGLANLAYGGYSLWVATRNPRPLRFVKSLAIANMAWLAVCIAIVVLHRNEISVFGVAHILGEGVYVAGLGFAEWRLREELAG